MQESEIDAWIVRAFINAHGATPEEIVLDLDATDDPIHGNQEGRFFHGYYGNYCYLPLYIFAGEHLLCARLRRSNIDGAEGCVDELTRIVGQIREAWPEVKIIIRADSGFCRDDLMSWCEDEKNRIDYVLGLAKNERLKKDIAEEMKQAEARFGQTQQPSRVFKDFPYQTLKSWSRERRVIGKAEWMDKGANPRFVVTSLTPERMDARAIYEDFYCARGDMENRIKEQQLDMFADRTSAATMRANQLRLYLSSAAYILMHALRRLGLKDTDLAHAQCQTIRLKLLKIGAQVRSQSAISGSRWLADILTPRHSPRSFAIFKLCHSAADQHREQTAENLRYRTPSHDARPENRAISLSPANACRKCLEIQPKPRSFLQISRQLLRNCLSSAPPLPSKSNVLERFNTG